MPLIPLFLGGGGSPPSTPATLEEAIAGYWGDQSLDTAVGDFYRIEIERMGGTRSMYEAQVCVVMDGVHRSVNVGKNKRGHDRIQKQFFIVGTDPITIAQGCRQVFDAFNRTSASISLDPDAGTLVGCRPTTAREARIQKCRLPIPSNKTLLQGQVDVEFILTRGEAP